MKRELEDGGTSVRLVAVSPERPDGLRELREERKLDFPLLHDAGNAVAREYGLAWTLPDDLAALYRQFGIDLAAANGDDTWTLPLPARYVIGPDRRVRAADVHPDYTKRPEPADTAAALRS